MIEYRKWCEIDTKILGTHARRLSAKYYVAAMQKETKGVDDHHTSSAYGFAMMYRDLKGMKGEKP